MKEKELLDKKREILKKLTLDENIILENLEKFVNLSIKFFKFDVNAGEIVITTNYQLSYEEKIYLLLVGKYFVNQYGIIENYNSNRQQIKEELEIPENTGISNQLKNLLEEKAIKKIGKDDYIVNIFIMEKKLIELNQKYK